MLFYLGPALNAPNYDERATLFYGLANQINYLTIKKKKAKKIEFLIYFFN